MLDVSRLMFADDDEAFEKELEEQRQALLAGDVQQGPLADVPDDAPPQAPAPAS